VKYLEAELQSTRQLHSTIVVIKEVDKLMRSLQEYSEVRSVTQFLLWIEIRKLMENFLIKPQTYQPPPTTKKQPPPPTPVLGWIRTDEPGKSIDEMNYAIWAETKWNNLVSVDISRSDLELKPTSL